MMRLLAKCKKFLSDWQTGFRSERGWRDNTLLIHTLYDRIVEKNQSCISWHYSYVIVAFDSTSHKFLRCIVRGGSPKSRTSSHTIYKVNYVYGVTSDEGAEHRWSAILSKSFNVTREIIHWGHYVLGSVHLDTRPTHPDLRQEGERHQD